MGCEDSKNTEKNPSFILYRSPADKGDVFDIDLRGKRLYVSDSNKLKYFRVSIQKDKDLIISNKVELPRPQGVIASYIYDDYLFEVTGAKRIRISKYNKPSKAISLIDQFQADTKLQFFSSYVFVGSGKHIAVIKLKDAIEIFKYTSFLVNITDIGVIGNILTVSLSDGSFNIYDLRILTEPVLITDKDKEQDVRYTHISCNDKYLFVVEENSQKGRKYIVKQISLSDLKKWRQVLLSYEEITKIIVKDDYLGLIRENHFLDVYKIESTGEFNLKLSIMGKELIDFEIINDNVFVAEKNQDEYLKLYNLN